MNNNNKILSDITVHMKYAKYIPELNRREIIDMYIKRKFYRLCEAYNSVANRLRFRPIDSTTAPIYLLIMLIALASVCFCCLVDVA